MWAQSGLLYTTGTENFLYTHANAVKDGRHGNTVMGENYKCTIYLYREISINQISILLINATQYYDMDILYSILTTYSVMQPVNHIVYETYIYIIIL